MRANAPTESAGLGGMPVRWITLGAMALTTFIGTWDVAAPVVALPAITQQFGVGIDSAVWVLTIESLMFAVPMAVFGKLGDLFGHKRTYLIAAGAFAVFSALAASARSFGWLIFFRALQGLAGSPTFTASMAFIGSGFPVEERGRAMGYQGMAAALGWALGPVLGGLLLLRFAWQSLLWVEIPLALVALGLAWRLMPEDTRLPQTKIDLIGAVSLTAAALALMAGLGQAGATGWTGGLALAMAGLFLVSLGVFVAAEARHPNPFVPLSLFADLRFTAATVFSTLQLIVMLALTVLIPIFLQEVNGVDPATAGLFVTGLSAARVLFAPLAGRLAELRGPRLPSIVATGLLAALALGFALWLTPQTPVWLLFAAVVVCGIGVTFGRIPVNTAATYLVTPADLGLALGVFSMITFAGGSLGQTFFGTLLRSLSGAGSGSLAAASRSQLLGAFSLSFAVVACLAVFAGALGLWLPARLPAASAIVSGG